MFKAPEFGDQAIADTYAAFDEPVRKELLNLRAVIYQVAATRPEVGKITESLKWGQPSYQTLHPKTGTPIRLGQSKDHRPAMFVHCQTRLIGELRDRFEDEFDFEGNRALVLRNGVDKDKEALICCIASALTYHL